MVGQDMFCRVVMDHLKKWNVEVEFSSELLSFEENEDSIVAIVKKGDHNESIESSFLVGADGGRGTSNSLSLFFSFPSVTSSSLTYNSKY